METLAQLTIVVEHFRFGLGGAAPTLFRFRSASVVEEQLNVIIAQYQTLAESRYAKSGMRLCLILPWIQAEISLLPKTTASLMYYIGTVCENVSMKMSTAVTAINLNQSNATTVLR